MPQHRIEDLWHATVTLETSVEVEEAQLPNATAPPANATAVAEAAAQAAEQAKEAAEEEAEAAEAAAAEAAAEAEAEEILPLEQWKEQAHAILQAHAIQAEPPVSTPGSGSTPGSAAPGSVGAAPPQPLAFVRPATPLKDRFNYLTSDVGAKVLATSEGMKGAGHILNNDRDSYMMAESDLKKKWVAAPPIPAPS